MVLVVVVWLLVPVQAASTRLVSLLLGAHCAPVSRLQLGYNSIPTADWGQPAAGLGAAAGAALAAGAGGSLSLHFVSVCGEAPRPSPPQPALARPARRAPHPSATAAAQCG